jgi:hypothetical protein
MFQNGGVGYFRDGNYNIKIMINRFIFNMAPKVNFHPILYNIQEYFIDSLGDAFISEILVI